MKDVQYDPKNYNPLYKGEGNIPQTQDWLAASSAARFNFMDRRGTPEIQAIDESVAEYNRVAAMNPPPTGELFEAAVNLLEACEVYLATPRGHKQKRLDAVHMLKAEVKAVLTKLRWQKVKEVTGGGKPGVKLMDEHVWSEMHSPGHARVGHGDNVLDPNPWLKDDPDAKEKYLFQYLKRVRAEMPNPDNVTYIEESERWKYQIVFTPTGLAHERDAEIGGNMLHTTRPITTKASDNLCTVPYAVDENGVFFTETSASTGNLNHCSFLGGKPVKCAGNIGITNGVIGYVDNGSGHYRPTLHNLLECLKALRDQVSPLYFDAILVRHHGGDNKMAAYLAGRFLATGGKCLPVGYYAQAGSGTHYRRNLIEFQNADDIEAFISNRMDDAQRTKLEAALKKLLTKLENNRINVVDQNGKKNLVLSGKLDNDEDRNVLQSVLSSKLIDSRAKDGLKVYYANDEPMKAWVRKQYNMAIHTANA